MRYLKKYEVIYMKNSAQFESWWWGSMIASILLLIIGIMGSLGFFEMGTPHTPYGFILTSLLITVFVNKPEGSVSNKS